MVVAPLQLFILLQTRLALKQGVCHLVFLSFNTPGTCVQWTEQWPRLQCCWVAVLLHIICIIVSVSWQTHAQVYLPMLLRSQRILSRDRISKLQPC